MDWTEAQRIHERIANKNEKKIVAEENTCLHAFVRCLNSTPHPVLSRCLKREKKHEYMNLMNFWLLKKMNAEDVDQNSYQTKKNDGRKMLKREKCD